MVIVKNKVEESKADALIQKIYDVCKSHPNLSPRSKKELTRAYKEGRLLLAQGKSYTEGKSYTVGWLLRIPYNEESQELAAGYVLESYRTSGVFKKLLQEAFKHATISIIVTFNKRFANYLLNKIGFKRSSLWETARISKGKFLLERAKFIRIKTIIKHYQTNKPIYTIFTR